MDEIFPDIDVRVRFQFRKFNLFVFFPPQQDNEKKKQTVVRALNIKERSLQVFILLLEPTGMIHHRRLAGKDDSAYIGHFGLLFQLCFAGDRGSLQRLSAAPGLLYSNEAGNPG